MRRNTTETLLSETGRKEGKDRRLARSRKYSIRLCAALRGIDPARRWGGAAMRAQLSLAYWPGCVGIARPTSEPCARDVLPVCRACVYLYRQCKVIYWTMSSALHSRLPAAPTSTYPFDDINLLSPTSPSSSSSCTYFFDQSRSVCVTGLLTRDIWDYVLSGWQMSISQIIINAYVG